MEFNTMTKEELALAVIERLKQEYPDADCTLDYDQAWKLPRQCPPGRTVHRCAGHCCGEDLYAKYPDIDVLANATPRKSRKLWAVRS